MVIYLYSYIIKWHQEYMLLISIAFFYTKKKWHQLLSLIPSRTKFSSFLTTYMDMTFNIAKIAY